MQPETLVAEIIKEQSLIIGENLAKSRAEDAGVTFNSLKIEDLSFIKNDPVQTIGNLIDSYEELFGQASVEVCIEVIKKHPFAEITSFLPESIKKRVQS